MKGYAICSHSCHQLPLGASTRIMLVSNPADWGEVVKELRIQLAKFPALGLDCEWVSESGKANPVCLLQLATIEGLVLLIRLNTVGALPICLKEILASFEVGALLSDIN